MRLGILTTHPIQYQVPWFRRLAAEPGIDLTVFFCLIPDARQQGDGFGVEFQWDLPLLEGYRHQLLRNVAPRPSVSCFRGCDTPEIARILGAGRFDAVIVNGWVVKSCLQALLACRRHRIPCLVRGESNALRPRPWHKRFVHRLLLRQYSGFLAIGKANRDFYLQNGVASSRIFMTPYGVANEWFAAQAATHRGQREEWRRQRGIPADAFVFLFSGKLIPKKRPLDILRAMAAPGQHRPWHLLIAGDGALRAECEAFALRTGAPVSFAGFLNQGEMPKAYAAADCLVLPSDNGETWGLVVNEAMASGVPAIVSDQVGCHQDLIVPGETGLVYPCGDVAALGRCLAAMAEDRDRCRSMGQAARVHVGAYSVEAVVAGIRAALAAISAEARPRS